MRMEQEVNDLHTERKTIGVIGAMKAETNALKAALQDAVTETVSGVDFVKGRFGNTELVVAQCGVGKVFAALCTQTMIQRYQPDCVMNIGVGGSLSEQLNIADVGIARAVVQHDLDTTAFGDPPGLVWGINVVEFPSDPALVQGLEAAAASLGVHTQVGVIASGDVFVSDAETKRRLVDTFSAIVCEMEGGAIAHVCYVNQVPFCVLRAVSDNGDEHAERNYSNALEMASDVALNVTMAYLKTL